MGLLDLLRRDRWSLDRVRPPWGEGTPIYTDVRAHVGPEGELPEGYRLPDPPASEPSPVQTEGPEDQTARAKRLATEVRALTERASEEGLARLSALARSSPMLHCVDELVAALTRDRDLDPDRLHAIGRYLGTRGVHREVVELGLTLLGVVSGPDDRDVLLTLGAHDVFTVFALVALTNRPEWTERDVWELAKRARGAGRLMAVQRLGSSTDTDIQAWLFEHGYLESSGRMQ